MTKTDIANLALSLIGGSPIVNLDTDINAQAKACKKWFPTARNESLIAHPWNFAMKRARLTVNWVQLPTLTSLNRALSNNGSGLIRVTTAAVHGLATGQRIHLRNSQGISGANGDWYVTVINTTNFDLDGSVFIDPNPSDGLPPHVNGTGQWVQVPLFDWAYHFTLPTDCLRVCNVNGLEGVEEDSIPYAIESNKILSNESELRLLYVRKMSDVPTDEVAELALWPDDFTNAFALLLGSYIAQELMGSSGKAMELRQQYESAVSPKVRGRDARQGKGRRRLLSYDSDVVRARQGGAFEG